ncbi:sigma-70 family RNA polymerase sigma factor [Pseudonocardia sp. H11422]|uniref:sigma-70 family RNA polymerase sigma factor n=1 Tax=Pseudonocardia sp. H11422 TaxID=2835866 RepID=UPI001BDD2068|nr:sigma-70 family RNA polymerase sigma factor [Pseudonocardia sp. H11422]
MSALTTDRFTVQDVWQELGASLQDFVRRRIADPDQAGDVVGDIMLRIHQHLDRLDDPGKVTSWVFRIARNAVIDHYRRTARHPERLGIDPRADVADPVDSRLDDLDDQDDARAELAGWVQPLLAALPPVYRRALELTDLEGHTQAEAARLEGISVSGMKSRVQRGRHQFAELLEECCRVSLDARGSVVDYEVHGECRCRGATTCER